MLVATKAGLTCNGPNTFELKGDPDHLIRQARASLTSLGVEQIGLWQLHRIDPKVPAASQFEAVKALLDEGTIRYAGLSEVSVADIAAASKVFPVATVQNQYNVADRRSEAVLDYCEHHGIGFIPWFPLGAGALTRPGSSLDRLAKKYGATTGQIALAWLLRRSPVMLPIPGTSKVKHLEENVAAVNVHLTAEDFASLGSQDQG
jgi:pyridoxine 4-dehydrogenase